MHIVGFVYCCVPQNYLIARILSASPIVSIIFFFFLYLSLAVKQLKRDEGRQCYWEFIYECLVINYENLLKRFGHKFKCHNEYV